MTDDEIREHAANGVAIDTGWQAFRVLATKQRCVADRLSFYAGAQHAFRVVLAVLDAGTPAVLDGADLLECVATELDGEWSQ